MQQQSDVQSLWAKYEDIAMHFNDLLMRLRSQSLAGIAAISALVGLFTRETGANLQMDWLVAEALFAAMAVFWIAIWCLDMGYYNRLLNGAVNAIVELEKATAPDAAFSGEIDMSRRIEAQFSKVWWNRAKPSYNGVVAFYALVLLVIVLGGIFSAHMHGDL
jgi:hypothetical protein